MTGEMLSEPRAARRVKAAPPHVRWAALGDSFTAGFSPGEETWVGQVRTQLTPACSMQLINLACAGAETRAVREEQLPIALAARPTLVTLICGGNDVIANVRPPHEKIARNLDSMLVEIRAALPDATLLMATYPPLRVGSLRPRTERRVAAGFDALNGVIRVLATRHGVECVDLSSHPARNVHANYAADGIHPSAAGHRVAAAVMAPAILNAIQRTRQEQS